TLDRLVADAIVRFDPETAAQRALEDLETRHARVTLNHVPDGILATGRLDAVVDAADALELDTILAQIAASLAAAGDTDPLDVRRAKALGLLARGELPHQPDQPPATSSGRRRQLVLHVSLTDTALHGCGDGIATLATPTGRPLGPVTVEQVQQWCATPDAEITVKPVIDLLALLTSTGYQPSTTLREQTVALHRTCVFPHCDRPAHSLDLDHIHPHATGGATASDNLAPLCRRHHRTKTHTAWTYTRLGPAEHLWTSPHGHQFLTDRHTTRDVSPDLRDTG
ncbi:MAG TPA: HNH endonuclease signature motif containing protein, partial [Nocardioides sp.]|uniref:HNH endonuclease signature motif containing protein n=1 Tax=Nocardioides sp. TaxID=35761 RepID=UPI002ED84E57